ncbi:MAG: iron transporter [Verrucomicrobia bacterium]|nr:MAG: iron transporter [Verrucomicrobiota bacterium]
MAEPAPAKRTSRWRFLSEIGPGIIAGAADDDPSSVATYSSAGAALGTSLLWTALITWPLMAAVQFMCARIGMVTGRGLAGAFHHKLPRPLIAVAACALFLANTINVGADLSGMADAGAMFTGFNSRYLVFIFGIAIAFATIQFRYQQIATILKWLALVLFAYVITALMVAPDWKSVLHDTFVPSLPRSHQAWSMLVAILGTTISPYLFFWQASQEVEEKKAAGRRMLARRQGRTRRELEVREIDVGVGTFFSNLVMYFIILTTALTLHRHGIINIETSKDAAEALRPLAGKFAAALFAFGVLGVGFLAIPTLTGSAAYAFAETFGWHQGLDARFKSARAFYAVVIISTLVGIGLDFAKVNPVRALFWTAVINGLLAPFLLLAVLLVSTDRKLMKGQPSSPIAIACVGLTTLLMFGAAIGMFIF